MPLSVSACSSGPVTSSPKATKIEFMEEKSMKKTVRPRPGGESTEVVALVAGVSHQEMVMIKRWLQTTARALPTRKNRDLRFFDFNNQIDHSGAS